MLRKKVLTIAMIFTLAFGITSGFQATSASAEETECPSCQGDTQQVIDNGIKELEDQGTITNMNVSAKEKAELNQLLSKKDKEFANELKLLKKDGFKVEKKANSYITFDNLKDADITYEHVGVVTEFMINDEKQVVEKQAWIDLKTKEVVRYSVVKFQDNGSSEPTVTDIAKYDVRTIDSTNTGGISTYKFTFSGVSFACSMSGVIACAAAFGGLAFYFPMVGAVLDIGCVIAFNAGCSTSIH